MSDGVSIPRVISRLGMVSRAATVSSNRQKVHDAPGLNNP